MEAYPSIAFTDEWVMGIRRRTTGQSLNALVRLSLLRLSDGGPITGCNWHGSRAQAQARGMNASAAGIMSNMRGLDDMGASKMTKQDTGVKM